MNNLSFFENDSKDIFESYSPFWHLWTPENHEIIFSDEETFRAGMNLFGICAIICKDIQIVTFELMSNHIHSTISGQEKDVRAFFKVFRNSLSRYLKRMGRFINLTTFACNLRQLTTLDDLRNVIAYNNRNGFLVHQNETPWTYPWGANAFFFNRIATNRFQESGRTMTYKERHHFTQSRLAEKIDVNLIMVDDFICPMAYCNINLWERLFINAHQYFFRISRNIEAQKKIAEELCDRIICTDDELYSTICKISKDRFDCPTPSLSPNDTKIELAKIMKYEYKASNKQIQRMLKLELDLVNQLFPTLVK